MAKKTRKRRPDEDGNCATCRHRHEPHSPGQPDCTICVRYLVLVANGTRLRRDGTCPGVHIDAAAFAHWFAAQPRRCHYCGIPERHLAALGCTTQMGLPLARLGVDRLDPGQGYRAANMVLCCFPCNKARSNTFTADEMAVIAAGVTQVWAARLDAARVGWVPGEVLQ